MPGMLKQCASEGKLFTGLSLSKSSIKGSFHGLPGSRTCCSDDYLEVWAVLLAWVIGRCKSVLRFMLEETKIAMNTWRHLIEIWILKDILVMSQK